MRRVHAMPFGAAVEPGGTRFRLWAPDASAVSLRLEAPGPACELPMAPAGDGFFEHTVSSVGAGARYRFRIDGGSLVPDPASRFQPAGVHGASEVIDPAAHDWRDGDWRGRPWTETVLYEAHVGALTAGGRFADAVAVLDDLAALGITALELMPLAQCPGARSWGYDGSYPYAPESAYGRPEDLKRLVEAAHARGLMVFLDVVYNHFGPEGNYLGLYASPFVTERHQTPWGAALDFEGPRSRSVRDFFIENALYWLEEFHLDGLRLDAVHAIHDDSRPDVLSELARRVRTRFAGERAVHLVLENDRNEARRLAREPDGAPRLYDAQWNDDAHHAFHVLLTGETAGYYEDFADDPVAHLGRILAEGFAWQGEPSPHRGGATRGEPSASLPPAAFVDFLQNHDQIGNRAFGERLVALAPREAVEAATVLLLLAPAVPLVFMGEEWGAIEPFPFFCDFGAELAEAVREGRRREFASFPAFRDPAARARIPDPGDPATFGRAVLDRRRAGEPAHAARLDLFRRLLAVRHREIVPRLAGARSGRYERLAPRALRVTWRLGDGARLTAVANLAAAPAPDAKAEAPGRLLFATPANTGATSETGLPAWSAAVWLAGPGDA